jgi:hypothetical protein
MEDHRVRKRNQGTEKKAGHGNENGKTKAHIKVWL